LPIRLWESGKRQPPSESLSSNGWPITRAVDRLAISVQTHMKRTQKKPGKATLADRLVAKLRKLGVSEKKAMAMAKSLTPLIRSVVNKAVREETAKTILEEHAEAAEDEQEG